MTIATPMKRRGPPQRSPLGARLHALRKAKGVTAADVAEAAGWSRSYYSGVEGGSDLPGREMLQAIAVYFGVTIDFLVNGTDLPRSRPGPFQIIDAPDEIEWVEFWRSLPPDQRATVLDLLSVRQRTSRTG